MLACVSKELPYRCRRRYSTQQRLNENYNKEQTRLVNFRKERKKPNHKQLDRAILKYKITYLEQMLLICDGKLFKLFQNRETKRRNHARSNTLGSRGYFFLIDTDGWRRSCVNEEKNRYAMRTCVCYLEIQRSRGKEGNASFANEEHLRFVSIAFGFHCGCWIARYASELWSF